MAPFLWPRNLQYTKYFQVLPFRFLIVVNYFNKVKVKQLTYVNFHLCEVAFNADQQSLWFMPTRVHNSEKILIILELQRNVNKENHRRPLMIQVVSWDSLLLSNFSNYCYSMCSTDAASNQVEFV